METQVVLGDGVYLPQLDLWLDARRRQTTSIVSHAHTDHWARHQSLNGTAATLELIRLRWPGASGDVLELETPYEFDGYRITLYPAGHCLGAAQVLIELKGTGERIVYTGDFNLASNVTTDHAPIIPCDTLIMDATYGHPRYRFPSQDELLSDLRKELDACLDEGAVPMVSTNATGKAQEILKLLLDSGYRIFVSDQVLRGVQVYEAFGVDFGEGYKRYGGEELEGAVLLVSGGRQDQIDTKGRPQRIQRIHLTGWAIDAWRRGWWGDGVALPFSGHADFDDLVRYAVQSSPSRIFTFCGFPHLAAELRSRGFDAWHLKNRKPPLF